MIWQYTALSKMGKEHRGTFKGSRHCVDVFLQTNELVLVDLTADHFGFVRDLLLKKELSFETLSAFFKDFGRMSLAGMTVQESFSILSTTTVDPVLKVALVKIRSFVTEGGSLKEAFANTEAFSSMVVASLEAAEKSGRLPEVLKILAEYYQYHAKIRKQIIHALAYPALVFGALTIASIIISTKLIPQLKTLLPVTALESVPTQVLLGYAWVMERYWGLVCLSPLVMVWLLQYLRRQHSRKFLEVIYSVPRLGALVKELELGTYFMSLAVYLKSGIVLNEAIKAIHQASPSYLTQRFVQVGANVCGGMTFWSAVKQEGFFPEFVYNNIRKGEEQGRLKDYVYDIYHYYEDKSREDIHIAVALINPLLLAVVVAMVGFLILAFFVPLYSGFGGMADQVYK